VCRLERDIFTLDATSDAASDLHKTL